MVVGMTKIPARSMGGRSVAFRAACLLVLSLTIFIAVHFHNDGHLDCARHCPSCASLQAAAPNAVVSVVVHSFLVTGSVVQTESRLPSTLLTVQLCVRPPPAF